MPLTRQTKAPSVAMTKVPELAMAPAAMLKVLEKTTVVSTSGAETTCSCQTHLAPLMA